MNYVVPSLTFMACLTLSCSTSRSRPCELGGQPPRENSQALFEGTKKCYQIQDANGKWVNDGKYLEWHANETLAIEGIYEKGVKTGRWIEYDENGNRISDKFYDAGKEIPKP